MRISTAGRYALRAMLDLAEHSQCGPVLRQDLASRQGISGEYLAQLFPALNRAGLVRSIMGPGGGYQLARPPEEIRVGEIIRAVEGPLAAVQCVVASNPRTPGEAHAKNACPRVETCPAHVLWLNLSRVLETYLDSVMLSHLATPGCGNPLAPLLSGSTPGIGVLTDRPCPVDFMI